METKQIIMLSILLLSAVIGSAWLIHILSSLDKEDGDNGNEKDGGDGHGHH